MVKKISLCIFILVFFINFNLYSAFEQREISARAVGVGGAYTAMANDIYSPYYNPAGLYFLKSISVGMNYYSLFQGLEGLDSISLLSAIAGVPLGFSTVGVSFTSFGFNLYKETTIMLTHSMVLGRVLFFGYNVKMLQLSIQDFGDASTIGVDVGVIGRIARNLKAGVMGYNINVPKIGANDIELNQKAVIGILYHPSSGLDLAIDFSKTPDLPLQIKAGTELRLFKFAAIRAGIQSNPSRYSFGLGILYSMFQIDYAYFIHNEFGGEHLFSLKIELGGIKADTFHERRRRVKEAVQEIEYTGPKININTATVDELTELPRVGPKAAQRIIDYRTQHGPFKSVNDLQKVKGFGPKTMAKLRAYITVGAEEEKKEAGKETGFDLNNATMKDFIDAGISPLKGVKILKYIKESGGVKDVEELRKVEGVTDEDIAKIKKMIGEK